jgi:reverse gyrase
MMSQRTILERMQRSITLRRSEVVLRSEFDDWASASQVTRALHALVEAGRIVRLGHGVYAKARRSFVTGQPVPRAALDDLVQEALQKMGIPVHEVAQVAAELAEAAAGLPTDRPSVRTELRPDGRPDGRPGGRPEAPVTRMSTGSRRVSRKFSAGAKTVICQSGPRTALAAG